MAVKTYTRQEMKGYIREKYQVPESYEIVVKQGHVTKVATETDVQKGIGALIALLALAAALAVSLSSCDDKDERERLEAEHERAKLAIDRQRGALLAMGVTHYEIVASGNENMCERCAEMNGQTFPLEELVIGENAPPFHPNCGCTIVEYTQEESLSDILTKIQAGEKVGVRYDEKGKFDDYGNSIEVAIDIISYDGIIAFTSVARSCDDGILTPEQRARRSDTHLDTLANGWKINPYDIPYVVLPLGDQSFSEFDVKLGDVIAVIYGGKVVYGLFVDRGPAYRLGEVSMRIQQELFGNSNPKIGHDDYDVIYVVFPGSGGLNQSEATYDAIQEIGQRLWNEQFSQGVR